MSARTEASFDAWYEPDPAGGYVVRGGRVGYLDRSFGWTLTRFGARILARRVKRKHEKGIWRIHV